MALIRPAIRYDPSSETPRALHSNLLRMPLPQTSAALGGAGVAISTQYSAAKLYNDPLLRTSVSLVAAGQGRGEGGKGGKEEEDALAQSISTALLLALVVGLVQVRG
jgi:hypothetical protein